MKKLAIIVMKEPYGDMNAAEAVRHALGAVGEEFEVSMILTDGGVLLALKGQNMGNTGFTNLGHSLQDCVDRAINVYAENDSLTQAQLTDKDLIRGIKVIGSREVSDLLNEADQTLIY